MVKISVVVPAHNEEGTIITVLERLEKATKELDYEIVVVNDASTDRTKELVEEKRRTNGRIVLVNRKPPKSFGRAIKDGLKHARGEVIIFVMADLCDEVRQIPEMVRIIDSGYNVAIASRFIKGGGVKNYPPLKLIFTRICNETIRIIFRIPSHDITNAFKAYRSDMLRAITLESEGFEILPEIVIKLWKCGARIKATPTVWRGRNVGVSKMNLFSSGLFFLRVILRNL